MRRAAALAALLVTLTATPAIAGNPQPTFTLTPGESVVVVADAPASVFLVGHHSTCGHGCVWELIDPLPVCPAGEHPVVTVTNVGQVTTTGKFYFDPHRTQTRNGSESILSLVPGCGG